MNIEDLREFCLSLPHVREDIKWGHDLCFCIGGKMFCVTGLSGPLKVSMKVKDEFGELSSSENIIPAPYVARYKWILVEEAGRFSRKEWEHYVRQSYELVKGNLSKKELEELGNKKTAPKKKAIKKKAAKTALKKKAAGKRVKKARKVHKRKK
jgi:predicted DNA-binding protein (MmcQ/YjbR family)